MVGGGTRTSQDIPPFIIAGREPVAYCGLNIVGLRRRGFAPEVIDNIHNAYRIIYNEKGLMKERLQKVREEVPQCKEVDYIISFFEQSQRGVIK